VVWLTPCSITHQPSTQSRLPKAVCYQLLAVIVIWLFFITPALALPNVSSEELIRQSREYDGQIVIYRGEVIGDVMVRGDSAWINVANDGIAMGVFLDAEAVRQIKFTGSYRSVGDKVEIEGPFYRAGTKHGGEMHIEAQTIKVISTGYEKQHVINTHRLWVAVFLSLIALSLFVLDKYLKKKRESD
jgi:hypothetical protein